MAAAAGNGGPPSQSPQVLILRKRRHELQHEILFLGDPVVGVYCSSGCACCCCRAGQLLGLVYGSHGGLEHHCDFQPRQTFSASPTSSQMAFSSGAVGETMC